MRHQLTDYEPKITASRNPILPRQPTIRAQRQASGEFKNKEESIVKLPPLDLVVVLICAALMATMVLVVLIEFIYGGSKQWL